MSSYLPKFTDFRDLYRGSFPDDSISDDDLLERYLSLRDFCSDDSYARRRDIEQYGDHFFDEFDEDEECPF